VKHNFTAVLFRSNIVCYKIFILQNIKVRRDITGVMFDDLQGLLAVFLFLIEDL